MKPRATRRNLIEDTPAIVLRDVRKQLGGPKELAKIDSVELGLPDGRTAVVRFRGHTTNIGAVAKHFVCPRCQRTCRVLRIVSEEPALACPSCLQRGGHAARYHAQTTHPSAWPREKGRAAAAAADNEITAARPDSSDGVPNPQT